MSLIKQGRDSIKVKKVKCPARQDLSSNSWSKPYPSRIENEFGRLSESAGRLMSTGQFSGIPSFILIKEKTKLKSSATNKPIY